VLTALLPIIIIYLLKKRAPLVNDPSSSHYEQMNKGEFRFRPISAFVYILALSQSDRVNRDFYRKYIGEHRWSLSSYSVSGFLIFFHEIYICCSCKISLQIPRGDFLFMALLQSYRPSNFAVHKLKY
jgi:hypothetical protein